MTVVHVNTERGWGGGEVQTCYLVRGLAAVGIRNLVVVQPGSELAARLPASKTSMITLPMRGECDALAVLRLTRLLRRVRPSVLHLHTSHAHTLGWLAGRLAGIASIVVTRRMDRPIRGYPSQLKYRHVDHIVAISRAVHKRLIDAGLPLNTLSLIQSGVDFPPSPPGPDLRSTYGPPLIGTVATLNRHKGHACVLQAMRIVARRYPRARLLIAGTGPCECHYRALAHSLGIARQVVFTGFQRDVPRLLRALDVFVHASENEGLGVALLEAGYHGLPMVATNTGGIPEIVRDGVTGLIVPPGDFNALAAKVLHLLDNPPRARELGNNAQAVVRREFSVARMVESYCRLYESLVARQPVPVFVDNPGTVARKEICIAR